MWIEDFYQDFSGQDKFLSILGHRFSICGSSIDFHLRSAMQFSDQAEGHRTRTP